ncbi:NAD(P)-dependent oxidoreductase [Streptomyces decoyicus]
MRSPGRPSSSPVLRDGDAVAEVMSEAIGRLDNEAVWVQASTVGPRADVLAGLAREHGVAYLDAPVSGSTAPARQGKLVWLVAGPGDVLGRARPLLEDLGSSVLHVGTGVEGNAVKLAVNAWMAASTVAMSDVLALCDTLGVDHATFVRVLEAGPLAMPYELQKVRVMDDASYAPGFAVQLALKDIELAATDAAPQPSASGRPRPPGSDRRRRPRPRRPSRCRLPQEAAVVVRLRVLAHQPLAGRIPRSFGQLRGAASFERSSRSEVQK